MKDNSLFDHMHLQWFAEGDDDDGGDDKSYEEMTVEELAALARERDEALERTKKAQAGSDREVQKKEKAVQDLQKRLDELEKEHMTEEERYKQELEKRQSEIEEREKKLQQAQLKELKQNLLKEAGLPDRFVNRIVGQNEEEIKEDIEDFKKNYTEEISAGVEQEVKQRFGDKQPPKGGDKNGEISYSDLMAMSDEQQAQFSPEQINEIIQKG